MQLLEEVQHDFGEGPAWPPSPRTGWWRSRTCGRELVWDRIAVVVRQLQVRGVLSVPVRLADQPVGTLNVYATQPRAWTPAEVQALGAFAVVTAELVRHRGRVGRPQVEVAQLRQALTSRVWIEQAKGMVAATQGVTLDEAFQQLRVRARSSSRKLAEVAQEVVQDVQRERVAAKALDDARVRAAGGARPGGRASPAGSPDRAGPALRRPGPNPRCPRHPRAGRRPARPPRRRTRPGR